ncbi:hypothetical protein GUJ93_ZPchr0010g10125 [Zizania palustris]|uniref:GB1/RHD3-type G domain-containing protein n=1 Tax=Zizania palustris TaxID=103762 RepID=A0A8J5SZB5_ZIZPA|nr:hypothetical protein GUJ93_ZPchr0010g10125 [Zizania palustris]
MATPTPSKVIQIVDHVKGKRTEFYEQDLSKFVAENCIQKNVHYPVFSIIGARSSGKSTLMNLMFNTKFAALNQSRGMNAASRGIWAATCNSPRAIVLDAEGSDGAEHQDDTSFEKKTALFALVISDLMFFNIKQDEIDRNNGGSIPLLRIVLQERLNHRMHKLKIVFVVRDYNDKISKEKLHAKLISMLAKIWGEKFPKNKSSNISDYFEITVEFLPNLDYYGKEEFRNRCAEMRNRNVNHFVAQHYTCPVEEFPRHANILWESIKKNIRLDMPSYWAITSSNRCKAVSDELLLVVKQVISQGYKKLPQHSKDDLNKMTEWLGDILKSSLTAYDDAVKCYHKETAMAFKEELKSQILLNAKPCFKQALDNYEITFGKNMADELECMIEACSNLNDHVILHPILDYIDEFKENITDSVLRSGMYQMGLTVKEWLDESGTGSSSFFPNLTNQVDFLERVKSPVQSKAMEAHVGFSLSSSYFSVKSFLTSLFSTLLIIV